MSDHELNDIPQDQTDNFPSGVSEIVYSTKPEMDAFVYGLTFAQDGDQHNGTPFKRKRQWVIRVCVGEWDGVETE